MPSRRPLVTIALGLAIALAGAACSVGQSAAPSSPSSPSAAARTPLTVGLGFIPSVQFAPFYLADQEGYYRDAGLDVTFQNKIDPDLITLVGQGKVDVGLADGTSVIPAVSQAIPVRYVTTIYGKFPSIVFSKASAGIDSAADLEGKTLGIPGRYGSSWVMLQALLDSAGLTPDDLTIREYPDFGQGVAVQQGAVDAATGFVNNEPVQLELAGEEAVVLSVDEIVPLPGNGLIVGVATLDAKRDALRAFAEATLRAMGDITADPSRGLEASIAAVPDLGTSRDVQEAILAATIEAWPPAEGGELGAISTADWEASIAFLTQLGLVPNPVSADQVVDTSLLGG